MLQEGHILASMLPELLVEASHVASTVAHGMHGRRQRGPGETFWQYRQYETTDATSMIDWRKSASTDHYYVREREWEAAHTVWIAADHSSSMQYQSELSTASKQARMYVLVMALTELLVRGGERVGAPGMFSPSPSRFMAQRYADSLLNMVKGQGEAAPLTVQSFANRFMITPQTRFSALSEVVLFSDFMEPVDEIRQLITMLASRKIRGHLVQILDPSEETLPFSGRMIFEDLSGQLKVTTEKVQDIKQIYQGKLEAHRQELRDICQHQDWSFLLHHTDRRAEEALLALYSRIGGQEV